MSTATGKSSVRKDKLNIGDVFEERDAKKAALNLETETQPVLATDEKKSSDKVKPSTEKGRGVKRAETPVKATSVSSLFAKEKKKKFQQKSVYLSVENVKFIQSQSDANDIAFSEVLNRIIDNFKENI